LADGVNPDAIKLEIQKASRLLARTPFIGASVQDTPIPEARKFLLDRIGYYLFYYIDADRSVVFIFAFRHVRRAPFLR